MLFPGLPAFTTSERDFDNPSSPRRRVHASAHRSATPVPAVRSTRTTQDRRHWRVHTSYNAARLVRVALAVNMAGCYLKCRHHHHLAAAAIR